MTDKTIQLRRYEILDGQLEAFLEFFETIVVPVRIEFGYTLEFAYVDAGRNEVTWAISLPGDAATFETRDAEYQSWDRRAQAFEGAPKTVGDMHVALVTPA